MACVDAAHYAYDFGPKVKPRVWLSQHNFCKRDGRLHQEIVAYVAYVQPTPQEKTARETLLEVIQKTLGRRFPDGEVKMFGSGATGLCLPTG